MPDDDVLETVISRLQGIETIKEVDEREYKKVLLDNYSEYQSHLERIVGTMNRICQLREIGYTIKFYKTSKGTYYYEESEPRKIGFT
jgi:hypothetical protein